jgi:hypothetical protein
MQNTAYVTVQHQCLLIADCFSAGGGGGGGGGGGRLRSVCYRKMTRCVDFDTSMNIRYGGIREINAGAGCTKGV